MSDAAEFARLRRVTPAEAVAALKARGDLQISTNWQDFWHEDHAHAFTVSRLTRLDILQSFHDGLMQSVQGDLSRRDWHKNAKTLLQQTGWWGKNAVTDTATGEQVSTTFNPSRLQLIYDINLGQAAAAGQWERLQAAKRTHPYARYITKRDERVREAHRRWDNLVLPVDHPFWQAHWPPNGWRCRCRAIGVSQREYDRGLTPTGAPMKKDAPEEVLRKYTNPRTGEITDLPVGIDPGFAYNAGVAHGEKTARQTALMALMKDKLVAADAPLGAAFWQEAKGDLAKPLQDQWRNTVIQVVSSGKPVGSTHLVAVIDQETQEALRQRGVELSSAAVLINDHELKHAIRDPKATRSATLPVSVWEDLPRLLDKAAIYFDSQKRNLVYVIDLSENAGKVAVYMNYAEKGRLAGTRIKMTANFVRTGGLIEKYNAQEPHFEKLKE